MSALSKTERARVYAIFDGRCAYCGCALPGRWHADHREPVIRYPEGGFSGGKMLCLHPERNTPDNYWPSCAPCNIDKHRMTIEAWRGWLTTRQAALMKTPGFKLLKAHGLMTEIARPVLFYFERPEDGSQPPAASDGEASKPKARATEPKDPKDHP